MERWLDDDRIRAHNSCLRMKLSALIPLSFLFIACSQPGVRTREANADVMRDIAATSLTAQDAQQLISEGAIRVPAPPPEAGFISLPMSFHSGVPSFEAKINGHRLRNVMLDTGAALPLFEARQAVKLGIQPWKSEQQAPFQMNGVDGMEVGLPAVLRNVNLDGWDAGSARCVIRTQENWVTLGSLPEYSEITLMGWDFFATRSRWLTVDYLSKRIKLGLSGTFYPVSSSRAKSVPFTLIHGVPSVEMSANGVTWWAVLDTGSAIGVTIPHELAAKVAPDDPGVAVDAPGLVFAGIGGGHNSRSGNIRVLNVPKLSAFGVDYPAAQIDVAPGPARVGSFFFSDYRVTFDFVSRRVWLEH